MLKVTNLHYETSTGELRAVLDTADRDEVARMKTADPTNLRIIHTAELDTNYSQAFKNGMEAGRIAATTNIVKAFEDIISDAAE